MSADARLDPVHFVRRVLKRDVFRYQEAPLRAVAPNVVVRGGRRSGKSQVGQYKALHRAVTTRDVIVLVVCPNVEKGRDWLAECRELLGGTPLAGSVVDEHAQVVRFSNGSEIRVVAATAGSLRGFGRRLLLVLLEEAGFLPGGVWRDIEYALLDNVAHGAQLWMSSTPWGGPEHPFRRADALARDGDEDYAGFIFRAEDNPLLPADYIARKRARLSPPEAAEELDGEWSEAYGSFFPPSLLERVTADLDVPPLDQLRGRGGIASFDWGISFDQTCFGALHRTPVAALNADREWRPSFVLYTYLRPVREEMRASINGFASSPVRARYLAPEVNAHGAYATQELRPALRHWEEKRTWCEVNTTSATKSAGYPCLLAHLYREQVVLPRDPDLLRQLRGVRYEQTTGGHLRIGAEDAAVHDDAADVAYLAMLPHRSRSGRVRCEFERLADPERAVPDAVLPAEYDDDIVSTGSGLRVYKRPPLQAVTGREVYLPRVPQPRVRRIGGLVLTGGS